MLTDRYEQELAQILNAGLPAPGPRCESRVLAALADIRPRRHPNLLTYIIVAALLLLLAATVFAAVRYFFVEGTLLFVDDYGQALDPRPVSAARVLSGELEWRVDKVEHAPTGDISFAAGEALFGRRDRWPRSRSGDIIKAKLDGSDPVNLTGMAGVGGLNCKGRWSPDRSMIAFLHCAPVEDMEPCEVGFHVWVMNADGTDARQVTPEGPPSTNPSGPRWSPDGSRLLVTIPGDSRWRGRDLSAAVIDIWGTQIQPLPNVGDGAAWSPDGTMIVSIQYEQSEGDGQPGQWNQLLLTDADGSDPRILVEQFIATADVEARYPNDAQLELDRSHDWVLDVLWWAGPRNPVWSPASDKIAFLAALPFDPDGPFHKCQTEVWVYDLTTDELIRVTDDDVGQEHLVWK